MNDTSPKRDPRWSCVICGEPAAVDAIVVLPACGLVRFCKTCLLALPGAITSTLAELGNL